MVAGYSLFCEEATPVYPMHPIPLSGPHFPWQGPLWLLHSGTQCRESALAQVQHLLSITPNSISQGVLANIPRLRIPIADPFPVGCLPGFAASFNVFYPQCKALRIKPYTLCGPHRSGKELLLIRRESFGLPAPTHPAFVSPHRAAGKLSRSLLQLLQKLSSLRDRLGSFIRGRQG